MVNVTPYVTIYGIHADPSWGMLHDGILFVRTFESDRIIVAALPGAVRRHFGDPQWNLKIVRCQELKTSVLRNIFMWKSRFYKASNSLVFSGRPAYFDFGPMELRCSRLFPLNQAPNLLTAIIYIYVYINKYMFIYIFLTSCVP